MSMPLEDVLAELQMIRTAVDRLIAEIAQLVAVDPQPTAPFKQWSNRPTLGNTAAQILEREGRPLHHKEILRRARAAGVLMNSKHPASTLQAALTKRRAAKGDVKHVGPGTWEWAGYGSEPGAN